MTLLLERYRGFTTPKLIKESLALLGADAASDGLRGAILTLLYGERKMQFALQQFLVENDHDLLRPLRPPPQPAVPREIGHITVDDSHDIALAPWRRVATCPY